MERRGGIRVATDLHAVVACPQFGLFRGGVKNISRTGVFVCTRNVNICVNAQVTLTLQDDDRPDSYCEAEGRVVHQNMNGFGVRLQRTDSDYWQLLEKAMVSYDSSRVLHKAI